MGPGLIPKVTLPEAANAAGHAVKSHCELDDNTCTRLVLVSLAQAFTLSTLLVVGTVPVVNCTTSMSWPPKPLTCPRPAPNWVTPEEPVTLPGVLPAAPQGMV